MAVAHVTSAGGLNNVVSPTIAITVSGTNPVLIVEVGLDSTTATISSVTWSLGSGTPVEVKNVRSGTAFNSIWAIPAPTAGAGTVTVNVSAAVNDQINVSCYSDAHQTTPCPAADAQTSVTTASSQTLTPTNLTASDGSAGSGVNTVSNNPGGVTPNQRYTSGASSVNMQTGDATGATGVTFAYDSPDIGAGNVAKVVVRIAQASAATATTDAPRARPLLMRLGQPGKAARPWALPTYQPSPAPYVPPVPPTLSPILARFEQNFGRQPMGRVQPKESSPRNSFILSAEVGSYALTGQSASLLATRLLNATAGSYVLTGKAAGLLAARLLNGTAGSYTITGRAALLAAARLLNAGAGAYTYTGRNGALLRGALLQAVAGAYAINGAAADLQQAGAGAFVFGAAPGSYSIAGFDALLTATTVTPTPTPSQSPASLGGGGGIQDRYWREREKLYDRTKRRAKKKSKRAVEIVEELAARELELSEAIAELHEELAAANLKGAEVYVELLRMKLEMVEEEDDDDDLLLLH